VVGGGRKGDKSNYGPATWTYPLFLLAAGATAQLSQDASLVRVKILSPTTRTVRWSVMF
jgi:hypothetical protein